MIQFLKSKISWLLIFIAIISVTGASAQYPAAIPGKEGIFVYFDNKLPVDFSYKLERKADDGKSDWQLINTSVLNNLNFKEVYNRLLAGNSKLPFYPIPDSTTLSRFINMVKGKKTIDSIYVFNAYPPYLEVIGTGYFDKSAKPFVKYIYRVSKLDKKEKLIESKQTGAASYPGSGKDFKATSYESTAWGNKINIRYKISGTSKPTGFRVYRQNYLQTPFKEYHPLTSFITTKSGYTMLLTDTLVLKGMIYRYVVIPYDLLGNDGQVSDTVLINNVPMFGQVPDLKDFEAISVDDQLAIKLRWKSSEVPNLRSISIFRSLNYDSGYTLYSKVPPTDTIFIDKNVEPITNYYYYLVFNGAYGDSPETAKVIGMVKGLRKPFLPPQGVRIKSGSEGNIISWMPTGYDTKGYYVFRGEGYSDPGEQISDLITGNKDTVVFIDKVAGLKPGQSYCYAVKAVNNSNLLSDFSQTVIASTLKPALPTPLNPEVRNFNGNAMIIWENMKLISPFVTGYNVWRAEKGQEDKKVIVSKDIELEANTFIDTNIERGKIYLYYIQCLGIINSESSLSAPFEFTLSKLMPVPPEGLRATKTNEGVILSWDSPALIGLKEFKIYREKLGEKKQLLTVTDKENTVYNDKELKSGTYFYTLTSVSEAGEESKPCDEIGVTIE